MRGVGRVLAVGAALATATSAAAAPRMERRCGWYENPTPANAWLVDGAGSWLLGAQGGYQVDGDVPDLRRRGWVVTNGASYGYGCGCLRGVFDHRRHRVVSIAGGEARTLGQCRADRTLPKPE